MSEEGLKQGEVVYCTLAVADSQAAIILDASSVPGGMMEVWAEDNTWRRGSLPPGPGLYRLRLQFYHTCGEDGEPEWSVLGYELLWALPRK